MHARPMNRSALDRGPKSRPTFWSPIRARKVVLGMVLTSSGTALSPPMLCQKTQSAGPVCGPGTRPKKWSAFGAHASVWCIRLVPFSGHGMRATFFKKPLTTSVLRPGYLLLRALGPNRPAAQLDPEIGLSSEPARRSRGLPFITVLFAKAAHFLGQICGRERAPPNLVSPIPNRPFLPNVVTVSTTSNRPPLQNCVPINATPTKPSAKGLLCNSWCPRKPSWRNLVPSLKPSFANFGALPKAFGANIGAFPKPSFAKIGALQKTLLPKKNIPSAILARLVKKFGALQKASLAKFGAPGSLRGEIWCPPLRLLCKIRCHPEGLRCKLRCLP